MEKEKTKTNETVTEEKVVYYKKVGDNKAVEVTDSDEIGKIEKTQKFKKRFKIGLGIAAGATIATVATVLGVKHSQKKYLMYENDTDAIDVNYTDVPTE